jgi:hypothetical protein
MKNIAIDRSKRLRNQPATGHNRFHPDQGRAVSAPGRAPGPAARRRWGGRGSSPPHESVPQRAVKAAVRRAELPKRASPHTLRPVAAYLDSGRPAPTTTNGGFKTPICPIRVWAPNRDTLQEVGAIVVLCRPAYPVAEF